MRVGPDVFAVDEVSQFELRKLLGLRNSVQGIAGGAEHSRDALGPFFKRLQVILAMVKKDAGKGVVNAVVYVIAALPVAFGFPDDLSNQSCRCAYHESAGLGKNFQAFRKQAIELRAENPGQLAERPYVTVVPRGESAPDIEQFEGISARRGFLHDGRRDRERGGR